MSTCTWVGLAPRIRTVESLPRLPERWISTPGTVRRASSTVRYSWARKVSSSITVTDAPICSSGSSTRVAVFTIGSARSGDGGTSACCAATSLAPTISPSPISVLTHPRQPIAHSSPSKECRLASDPRSVS